MCKYNLIFVIFCCLLLIHNTFTNPTSPQRINNKKTSDLNIFDPEFWSSLLDDFLNDSDDESSGNNRPVVICSPPNCTIVINVQNGSTLNPVNRPIPTVTIRPAYPPNQLSPPNQGGMYPPPIRSQIPPQTNSRMPPLGPNVAPNTANRVVPPQGSAALNTAIPVVSGSGQNRAPAVPGQGSGRGFGPPLGPNVAPTTANRVVPPQGSGALNTAIPVVSGAGRNRAPSVPGQGSGRGYGPQVGAPYAIGPQGSRYANPRTAYGQR